MAKKRTNPTPAAAKEEKPATLKDLLRPDVLEQLKAKANELTSAEEKRREEAVKQAEGARKPSRKGLIMTLNICLITVKWIGEQTNKSFDEEYGAVR